MIATLTPTPTYMPPARDPSFVLQLVTTDGRRAGWCWGSKPRCTNPSPIAHRLQVKNPILTEALVRCEHRVERGAAKCDTLIYVRRIRRHSREEAQQWFLCEVTPDYVDRLREPMMDIELLTILGCVVPGSEFDLPRCVRCGKSIARHNAADHEFEAEA